MLSGSVAMSLYTIPRATRDIDFVISIRPSDVDKIVDYFKHGYYCDRTAINDALRTFSMFNIIDHASGFKADFVILKNLPFRQEEFRRKQLINFDGDEVYVVSPEDLLISKIIWIQEYQSAQQMEDIRQLSKVEGLDLPYVQKWISELGLETFNLL